MKAARYYGPRDVRVDQIDEPEAKEGQVKIKIAWSGICGSDLHAYITTMLKYPTATEANAITGEKLPVTLGHEFSGTIVALGNGVDAKEWPIGQKVVVEPLISCMNTNTCTSCAAGTRNICPEVNFIGICGWGGGMSEFVATDIQYVHKLPDGVSLEVGACVEPLAVAWHAVKRSGYKKGQSVLIVGTGPIGLFLLKVLRSIDSTANILVSEPASVRRALALKHGATQALNPIGADRDIPAAVYKATGGVGVDFAFDAAGIQAGLDSALLSLRARGKYVNVSVWEESPKIFVNLIVARELTFTGTMGYDRVHPEVLQALKDGKLAGIEELITSKISVDDVVEKGFHALLKEKDTQVKIIVHP